MSENEDGGGMTLDLGGLMQKAREMQGNMQKAQETAAQIRVEGNAGGGMVVAEANGNGTILRLSIEQKLFESGDREMIEDLTVAAVNQAQAKAKDAMQEEMQSAMGGLQLPFDINKLV